MLAAMPWRVWQDWQAFLHDEPLPGERGDLQAAMLAAVTASAWSGKRARIEDFLLRFEPAEPPKERTPDELHAKMMALFPGVAPGGDAEIEPTDVRRPEIETGGT